MVIDDPLLTADEAAAYLKVHPETIKRMLRRGVLRGSLPVSRRAGWRIRRSELDRVAEPAAGVAPPPTSEPRAVAVAEALHRAELARAAGDDELAARFEAMAGGMAGGAQR